MAPNLGLYFMNQRAFISIRYIHYSELCIKILSGFCRVRVSFFFFFFTHCAFFLLVQNKGECSSSLYKGDINVRFNSFAQHLLQSNHYASVKEAHKNTNNAMKAQRLKAGFQWWIKNNSHLWLTLNKYKITKGHKSFSFPTNLLFWRTFALLPDIKYTR